MKFVKYVLCLVVLLHGAVLAHTGLRESVPAEGSVLSISPERLILSFTEEVRLLRLDVLTTLEPVAEKVDIGFVPESATKAEYSFQLPDLSPGSYRVDWSVMGADSHTVQGSVAFSVGTEGNMPEHQEGHAATHGSHAAH